MKTVKNTTVEDIRLIAWVFDLQAFAATVVPSNATANMQTSSSADLSPEFKTFSDEKFLRMVKANLVYEQFAEQKDLPKNKGKTIEFFKKTDIAPVTTALTEGYTPDPNKWKIESITVTLAQYGDWQMFTDVALGTSLHDLINAIRDPQAYQAARTRNLLTRNILVTGAQTAFASSVVDGEETEVTAQASLTANAKLTVKEIQKQVTRLKNRNILPFEDGNYVMVVHPDTAFDLWRDPEYQEMVKYQHAQTLQNGDTVCVAGCRIVESTDTRITTGTGNPSGLGVYHNLVFGKGAYGVVKWGGQSVETIAKGLGSAGTADPLNQRATVGFKFMHAALVLDRNGIIDLMTCATNSKSATAN